MASKVKRNYLLGCGLPAIARHTAKILRSSQATTIGWTLRTAPRAAKTRAMATRIRSFFIFENLSPIVRSAVAAATLVRHGRDRAEGHQGYSAVGRQEQAHARNDEKLFHGCLRLAVVRCFVVVLFMTSPWATLRCDHTLSCAKGCDGNHQIVEPAGRR